MTVHCCNVTNLSGSDRSREHSPSIHYKSLLIGQLLCHQVCFSSRAHWALGGAGAGIRLTLSEWLRYVYPGGNAAYVFEKGHPAAWAFDRQTSQCAKILPVSPQGQAPFDPRHHHLEELFPSWRQSHSSFTSLLGQTLHIPVITISNCPQLPSSVRHMSVGLKLSVLTFFP